MTINKKPAKTSLVMEIQVGTDETDSPIYKKKTFSGVKPEATADDIHAVATAISEVLTNPTENFSLVETATLEQAEE